MGIGMNKPNFTETNNREGRKPCKELNNRNEYKFLSESKSFLLGCQKNAMPVFSRLILTHNLNCCKGVEREAQNISFVQKCWNSSAGQQCRKFCLPKSSAGTNTRPPSSKDYIPQTCWIFFLVIIILMKISSSLDSLFCASIYLAAPQIVDLSQFRDTTYRAEAHRVGDEGGGKRQ